MEKAKKVKLILGLLYLLIIIIFIWLFFSKFSLNDFRSYEFIKNNTEYLQILKENNFLVVSLLFIFFTVIWVSLLGFGSPIFLLGGFIFGKWFGTLIVAISLTIGATLLYLFASYFLKDLIEEKFLKKYSSLKDKFKRNEFIVFLLYRFIGGIPFFIANILPVLFNVKLKNYFFGTLFGMLPQLFIGATLGSGIEKILSENLTAPTFIDILTAKDVYYPILAFILLLILGLITKKKYF